MAVGEYSQRRRQAMKVGMLWYDSDPSRGMEEKVELAAAYYREKYGRRPNLCLIHPDTAGDSEFSSHGMIEVRLNPSVLQDHFWMGMRPEEVSEAAA
jgi:hypothetical protein